MPSPAEQSANLYPCSKCRQSKNGTEFKTKSDGSVAKRCVNCQGKTRDWTRQKKDAEKENDPALPDVAEESDECRDLAILPPDTFRDDLVQQDDNLELMLLRI
ncbi:hypothetical protein C8R45DRAFT_938808 [Mycena sanguinolenta]|nr:hypothetical protein C8R45DRAFT_938808 [Mycena sanguinolenta]